MTHIKHGSEIKNSYKNAVKLRVQKIDPAGYRTNRNNDNAQSIRQPENCDPQDIRIEKGRKAFIRKRINELRQSDVLRYKHKNKLKKSLSVGSSDGVLICSSVFLAAIMIVTLFMSWIAAVSPYASATEFGYDAADNGSSVSWTGTGIFSWPLDRDGHITSSFDIRTDPFSGGLRMHGGTDIAAPSGTPVLAAADGRVIMSNWYDPDAGGYGLHVMIDHGDGYQTLYGHCSFLTVMEGQYVKRGEIIAGVGSTGNSTGPHLHFEVRINGIKTDPMQFFLRGEESGIISEENNTGESP